MKFGGTSVGSPDAVEKVAGIVSRAAAREGGGAVVVVSAFSGVTDALASAAARAARGGPDAEAGIARAIEELRLRHTEFAARFLGGAAEAEAARAVEDACGGLSRLLSSAAILKELSARTLDHVMSFGERLSSFLIARAFAARGLPCEHLDARDLIVTDARFGHAAPLAGPTYARIRARCAAGRLYVAPGFIAATEKGETSTLGRGGSDFSAAIFAAALDARLLEIWTDVNGVLSCDPKIVRDAFTIGEMPYVEALEMSHFGAKVLHPPTIRPVMEKNIPLRILNTFDPDGPSTLVSADAKEAETAVRGISSIRDVAMIRAQGAGLSGAAGFASRLFGALGRRGVNVILITQASSEYSICFAVRPEDAEAAREAVEAEFEADLRSGLLEPPAIETGLSVVAVVGSRMKSASGVAGRVFHALGRSGINVVAIAQGSSEINISLVVARESRAKAMNAVHEAFFLSGTRSVNLFLAGLGLVGGTLLRQITEHCRTLARREKIRIRLTGLANSRRMAFDADGIDLERARETLDAGEPYGLDTFIARMRDFNLPNTAFCDCTASEDVALKYADILAALIPVVTPNKKANSGALDYYRRLTGLSRGLGVPYLYEVTVCAGLPVISTLRDLSLSGDRVVRVEAVLSGTLSFIFNNFDGGRPFSRLVREAKEKGYTEPDPRDDLRATDAARKALILARECGMPLEFSDIRIESILPDECARAATVEGFFAELEKADSRFEEKRERAAAEGRLLRYVAVIEDGAARIALRECGRESPFCGLVDADNIVVITTERYNTLPIVIKGPGAGAEVTAGGVFADIARIARSLV